MIPLQHTINTPYMVGPVHCYTAELGGDLVLFDTGPPTRDAQKFLQENVDLKRLKHVIVTHCHIDHYGLAAWLGKNSGAIIYLPEKDCLKIANHDQRMEEMYQLLLELGFTEKYLLKLREIFDSGALFPPFPKHYLATEQALPAHLGIEVICCPGHSQSDLIYAGKDWAVTGDTLLRGVFQSPLLDVDLVAGGRFQNYLAYTKTIRKIATIRSKTILPGHRKSIKSVDETLLFYVSKMLSRAAQLYPYKDEENLFLIIEKVLEGRMQEVFHVFLKASEIVFMKDFLQQPELLKDSLEKIGLFADVSQLYYEATAGSASK